MIHNKCKASCLYNSIIDNENSWPHCGCDKIWVKEQLTFRRQMEKLAINVLYPLNGDEYSGVYGIKDQYSFTLNQFIQSNSRVCVE